MAVALVLVLAVAALVSPAAAGAQADQAPDKPTATIIVTNLNDSGAGSLRQAIADANPGDTINFGLSGTIYLDSQLTINKALAIDGSGQTIAVSGDSGNNGSPNVRVFEIWSIGALTMTHMTVISGTATPDGGGAYVEAGGALTVQNSTFTGNSSTEDGAAIENGGTLTISHSTISGNSAGDNGGGIFNEGDLTISNSTIGSNTAQTNGGALYNASIGSARINNSTISGNTASGGGGVVSFGTLTVINSTISGNTAASVGGGIITASGTASLLSSTVTANHSGASGGGIRGQTEISLQNTIVAGNSATDSGPDLSGATTSNDYNLIGNLSGATFAAQPHDITGQPAQLGPLANNGGPTQTHALLPGSVAIDAGETALATDQRGVARPQGTADDIGAYEAETGKITVVKDANPADNTVFDFEITGDPPFSNTLFSLQDPLQPSRTFTDVVPGIYGVAEDLQGGWALTDIVCQSATGDSDFIYAVGIGGVNIDLAPGDAVTCTFVNKLRGSITVVKDANPADNTVFDFEITGDPPFSNTLFSLQDPLQPSRSFTDVVPGIYSVSEALQGGWALTDIVCQSATGDSDFIYAVGIGGVNIDLAPGDDVTCTFVNKLRGSITVVKDANPADNTVFDFEITGDPPFSNTLFSLQDPLQPSRTFTDVVPGIYGVSEALQGGWALTDIVCQSATGDSDFIYAVGIGGVNVDLAPGDDVTCTFLNIATTPTAVTLSWLAASGESSPVWAWLLVVIGAALAMAAAWQRRSHA